MQNVGFLMTRLILSLFFYSVVLVTLALEFSVLMMVSYLNLVMRESIFGVSNQLQLRPATEEIRCIFDDI